MVVDDALDVLGVHGVGGALGTLALPFLAGLGVGGAALHHAVGAQFLVQAQGVRRRRSGRRSPRSRSPNSPAWSMGCGSTANMKSRAWISPRMAKPAIIPAVRHCRDRSLA